jgi:hypothetical protein
MSSSEKFVILSEAKDLLFSDSERQQVLRFAQDDRVDFSCDLAALRYSAATLSTWIFPPSMCPVTATCSP